MASNFSLHIQIIEQIITTQGQSFKQFWFNHQPYEIGSLTEDNLFPKLLHGSLIFQYHSSSNYKTTFNYKFEEIEKLVNPDLSYKERESLVLNNGRIDYLKKQIAELENSKIEIRKSKLSTLISDELIMIIQDSDEQNELNITRQETDKQIKLINILLRNGYIDENYLDYISIFYEGSLAKADYQFLINVKIQRHSDFEYKLTKIERLIEKINLFDFEKEYVLNFDLVDSLQQKPNDFEKKKRLFRQLSNQSPSSIKFIDEFSEITTDIKVFIQTLCKYWQNIWTFIETESIFDNAKKDSYFKQIIKYAQIEDIKSIFSSHHKFLNKRADFLQIINDEKKLKKIIERLDLKFDIINSNSPESLIEFVYKGKYYDMNKGMIELLLKHYKKFDINKFANANFSLIMTSSLTEMIDYINSNINDYISNVYLEIETNTDEPLDYYLKLLNYENLDEDLKEELIIQVNTRIEDIKTISDTNLWSSIFKYSKVKPKWQNILAYFEKEENEFSEELIEFLNSFSNAIELSIIKMPTKVNEQNIFSDLCRSIITLSELTDESYDLITKAIPWWYSDLGFGEITKDKIISLIKNEVVQPTVESFNNLKETHDGLNIRLLEEHPEEFAEEIDEIEFDSNDLELILKSTSLNNSEKNVFIMNSNVETINSSNNVLKLLSDNIIRNVHFDIENSTIRSILLCKIISSDNRIRILNQNLSLIDNTFLESFLNSLGHDYQQITNYDKKAKIMDNSINRLLLDILVNAGFISSYSDTKRGLRVNHKRK